MNGNNNQGRRLVVVSNRLPFNVNTDKETLQFSPSAGGLATGLSSYLAGLHDEHREFLWVGWPGASIEKSQQEQLKLEALAKYRSHPVFLTQEDMDQFYLGFCNQTVWPLFHYFPSYTVYQEKMWKHYQHVNEVFCDSILEVLKDNDTVWIHDYHVMLLPRLLKAKAPNVHVGFFLHIPFPSFEIFRLLPGAWRRDILEGLLGADLIGFHTYEYTQHFLQCALRILGHEHHMGQILTPDRVVKAETFPMGIDYDKFARVSLNQEIHQEAEAMRMNLGNAKVILSVDRLDYTKGILNRLEAFEILLDTNPQLRGKVVLMMIVVPSRIGVEQYDLMKRQVEELVGKINGKFSNVEWTPIVYQYRNIPFTPLVAYYTLSDIALVTPLRDGMNLVAKEYVASRTDGSGVLILSEMAGAAKELGESITINPNDRNEIAEAMKQALSIPLLEQQRRMLTMQDRLRRYNVNRWADDFLIELQKMEVIQNKFGAKLLSLAERQELITGYHSSATRLFLLDYDGTLTMLVRYPSMAKPTAEILYVLAGLTQDPNNEVALVSGRDKNTLQEWFGELPIALVAEHGHWIKKLKGDWKELKQQSNDWKEHLRPVLELYADRLPGAMMEEKDNSLAWHFRGADPEQSTLVASELTDYLVSFTANIDIQILRGHKVIEVRTAGINKGTAAQYFLAQKSYDFVLGIGDDWTDEDLFNALPDTAHSIKVGVANTHARFNLRNPREVLRFLESLMKTPTSAKVLRAEQVPSVWM
jgi:trehalose 6-phosphate synthase/phosphatase